MSRRSSEGGELGRSSSSHTDLSVPDGLVGERVLSEEVADHVSLDFDGVPVLSSVHLDHGSAHLGHNDGVSEVSLDGNGLLSGLSVLLLDSEFFDQPIVFSGHSVSESSLLARVHEVHDLLHVHVEESVELVASVDLLLEWLLLLGRCSGHVY